MALRGDEDVASRGSGGGGHRGQTTFVDRGRRRREATRVKERVATASEEASGSLKGRLGG